MSTPKRDPNDEREDASATGYGKPPQSTRFRKGVSGNPRGRPKGSRNVACVFAKALREKVVINENGQRKTITKLEAAIKQFVNKAASGDFRSLQLLVHLSRETEGRELSTAERSILGEFDQRVIDGIIRRFQPLNQTEGANNEEPHSERVPGDFTK